MREVVLKKLLKEQTKNENNLWLPVHYHEAR